MDFTPQTLRYDRAGVEWIICHAETLKRGEWPGGLSTEYLDTPISSGRSNRAPFENPCLIIAELEIRVKRCGLDGFLAEEKINGKTEEEIARDRYLDIDYVRRRINKVLWYCSSGRIARWIDTRKRKGQTYEEWLRGWHWKAKKIPVLSVS
jgi:hypothetical protein